MNTPQFTPTEKKILGALTIVQFVNVLDFMIVMPLGPDLGRALGISMDHLGWIGGSYTFAAFWAGLAGAFYLDKLRRKQALLLHLLGLSVATLATTFATDLWSLLAARVAAGLCGGPATSTMLAILSDVIRPERRGRALGMVMGAFSVASIIGVPIGLELAERGGPDSGWKLPFLVVGVLALLTVLVCAFLLPSFEHHRDHPDGAAGLGAGSRTETESLFSNGVVPISLFLAANGILATFLIVPNLSTFMQFNLGFPREKLGMLYFSGGILSLLSTRLGGIWNDRAGSTIPVITSTSLYALLMLGGMIVSPPLLPAAVFFSILMLANSLRWISISTLTSKVPSPRYRARYMSLLSAAQHLASSSGAFLSTQLLTSNPDGSLAGVPRMALVSMGVTMLLPPLVILVERMLKKNKKAPAPHFTLGGSSIE
ncbi:MAG: MFS transporter [Oligoflexia bacterium]